jgi:hypothetical protein
MEHIGWIFDICVSVFIQGFMRTAASIVFVVFAELVPKRTR